MPRLRFGIVNLGLTLSVDDWAQFCSFASARFISPKFSVILTKL